MIRAQIRDHVQERPFQWIRKSASRRLVDIPSISISNQGGIFVHVRMLPLKAPKAPGCLLASERAVVVSETNF